MYQQLATNPKALNLEGLEEEKNKVTVGFKCHAQTKLHLANVATIKGLTLSEYVETLIMTNGRNDRAIEKLAVQEQELKRLNEQGEIWARQLKAKDNAAHAKEQDLKTSNEQVENLTRKLKTTAHNLAAACARETQVNADLLALERRLDFYEKDPVILSLLADNQGTRLSFAAAEGGTLNLDIETVQDVFTVLVHKAKKTKR